MGLFSCATSRKRVHTGPSRPMEGNHMLYQDALDRRGEGHREWLEAEARRKKEEQRAARRQAERRQKPQWAGGRYSSDQYPTMQEIEAHEMYGPRGRNERYVPIHTPPSDNSWRNTRARNPNPWMTDSGVARPEQSRVSRAQTKPQLRVLVPENATQKSAQAYHRPRQAQSSNKDVRIPETWKHRDIEPSSIIRNAKYKPAPKQGKRVLYTEDAATATRRNMGF